jgi:heme-degrading monooxygenase HmoA
MEKMVIELAPFKVAAATSEASLLEASNALQLEFLAQQPGFVKRELLRSGENDWLDIVYWRDHDSAHQAMQKAMENPACHRYFQLMVAEDHSNPGNGVKHYERISEY